MSREKIEIVFQNADWAVIHKPAILDSQNSKESRYSVVDWLQENYGFAGLVHRLDFGTSGLMVCAKNSKSAETLTRELNAGRIKRKYQAVVMGADLPDEGEFNDALDEKEALTRFKVLQRFANACHVDVEIVTGRKHQIRRHFSDAGHPVIGDHFYKKRGSHLLMKRPALHAYELEVLGAKHTADLPADFLDLIQKLQ